MAGESVCKPLSDIPPYAGPEMVSVSPIHLSGSASICCAEAVQSILSSPSGEIVYLKDRFLHEFACHPCAGAMLIFSVSFQFKYDMQICEAFHIFYLPEYWK